MCKGIIIRFIEGWLALTGHLGSPLAKKVTQHSIKGEFDPIDSVWMIWYCFYAMWAYSLSVVPQTIGWWSPNPSSLLFHLPFYLLQVYGVLMSSSEDYYRIILQPPSISIQAPVKPMLHLCSQPLAGHDSGLLPLNFGSIFVMVSK